jgi:hypothetical protein
MDTTIGYLHEVCEDLLAAAWRADRRSGERGVRRGLARPRSRVIAVVAAGALVVTGGVGWLETSGNSPLATHRFEERIRAGGRAIPSASPAPRGDQFRAVTTQHAPAGVSNDVPAIVGTQGSVPDLSKVIKTAELSVVVPRNTFQQRFADASRVAGDLGGYVSTSNTAGRSGSVTMRVPADRFDEALGRLRAIGHVENQTIVGKDVTADYIDLNARLRIAKARRAVLLQLMQKAHSIEQTIRVQNALDDTQQRIEDLQGSLNVLNDKVAYSTISLSLREQGVQPHIVTHVTNPSILTGWRRAIAGFIGVVVAVIVGLGYVIPIALLLGIGWLVVSSVRRRRVA